jgi:hypothetical protein
MRKLHIYLFLCILILVTILFIWNELGHLSFHEKINHDKVGSYFTTIAAIVTATAFLLIVQQTELMKMANTNLVKPNLFIEDINYSLVQPEGFGDTYLGNVLVSLAVLEDPHDLSALIKLLNIGQGIAFKVSSKWEYDQKEVLKITQGLYDDSSNVFNTRSFQLDYLKVGQERKIIMPPYRYINLFGNKLLYKSNYEGEHWVIRDGITYEIPKLKLKVSYKDVHGVSYEDWFKVDSFKYASKELKFSFQKEKSILIK